MVGPCIYSDSELQFFQEMDCWRVLGMRSDLGSRSAMGLVIARSCLCQPVAALLFLKPMLCHAPLLFWTLSDTDDRQIQEAIGLDLSLPRARRLDEY